MSQKTVLAVNGSPRRKGNTAELLRRILEGAQSAGAATELVNLYDLDFKGCISCFSCKRKDRPHGVCAMKDDLSPAQSFSNNKALIHEGDVCMCIYIYICCLVTKLCPTLS